MNILYLGSKKIGYECLLQLVELSGNYGMNIAGVLTNEKAAYAREIIDLASKNKIPVYKDTDDILSLENIDLLISVQYHRILKKEHISIAGLAVNYHMAPLPEYRGCNHFSFALFEGAKEFGTTVHRLDVGIDSGDIIDEIRFPIDESWDVSKLYTVTYDQTLELFRRSIMKILKKEISFVPQTALVGKRGTKLIKRKDIESLKRITETDPISVIAKKVKATSMPGFEPAFFIYEGEKYYIIPEKHFPKNDGTVR
jgi:methionyl-tRNA formyltransferase